MAYSLHGANYENMYKDYNLDMPDQVIDFSTNTNVICMNGVNADIEPILREYPSVNCNRLITILSHINSVKKSQILVTNGSNEAIYLIASLFQNKKIGIVEPTYPEYKRAFDAYDIETVSINISALFDDDINCDCIFLCNPNNPTGDYIEYDSILEIVKRLSNKGISLVIDEAYIDFLNTRHKMININEFKNVYILRSLTKSYQLAGVRIGYVISQEDHIEKLKKRQPTWSVNGVAQALALKCLENKEHLINTKAFYKEEVNKVICAIRSMGYDVLNTDVNFFLMKIENDDHLIIYLLKKGLVVRHTKNHIGLDGHYVRIAVRTPEENKELLEALSKYENISD